MKQGIKVSTSKQFIEAIKKSKKHSIIVFDEAWIFPIINNDKFISEELTNFLDRLNPYRKQIREFENSIVSNKDVKE